MNINYETYIKEEGDDERTTLSVPELNIPVKNEPIIDDSLPYVQIINEPINEVTLTEADYNIKIEDSLQNHLPTPSDGFIIYELQTPAITKQVLNVPNKLKTTRNITQLKPLATNSNQALTKQSAEIQTNLNSKSKTLSNSATISPPVLLNTKLRKRNKVVIPTNPIDKKMRYNIEGVKSVVKTLTADKSNFLYSGNKKIINHLIKNKRKQREGHTNKSLEQFTASEKEHISDNGIEIQSKIPKTRIGFPTKETTIQTELHINSRAHAVFLAKDLKTPKETSNTPELRVKCLCSLTADTSNNTSYTLELRDFFQKMFEKTRRLSKKQQRNIKMTLLQVILDAENSVEQGKCCSF